MAEAEGSSGVKRKSEAAPQEGPPEKRYQTHDNGGRPFEVSVTGLAGGNYEVLIKRTVDEDEDGDEDEDKLAWQGVATRVLVGVSPCGDGIGPEFDGNSLLLELDETSHEYLFVGTIIASFTARARIKDNVGGPEAAHSDENSWKDFGFVSPVGRSDVPYPYAVDQEGTVYLMLEGVCMDHVPPDPEYADKYSWYYKRFRITRDLAMSPPYGNTVVDSGIEKFFLGKNEFSFTYTPRYETEYARLVGHFGGMSIQRKGCAERENLDLKSYTKLMEDFGQEAGFSPFHMKTLVERRW